MSLVADLKTLYHLALSPVAGGTHAQRLESFYSRQADAYDSFRDRLLHGRQDLYDALPADEGAVWVELGGGTASNLEYLGDRLNRLAAVHVVDLSSSLLRVARGRALGHGWSNVACVEADATRFSLAGVQADVVTFSYSLTMIPNWFAAIERAWQLLRPGGVIGVVDFYVARKHPAEQHATHGWLTRHLWPAWFASDNVCLSADHLPYLEDRFETIELVEDRGALPYVPLARVPYYRFIGRKPDPAPRDGTLPA